MFICFLYIMDQWLKRGTSSTQLSTTIASTDVTDTVIESHCFILSFSADSSRTAESKKSKSTMIPICLWSLCIQVMKLPIVLCILCSKVLPNSSMSPAKLHKHHYNNHTACKDKDISFFKSKLETFTNCQTLMVKSSKTDNEIT
jgi:hypothetical protein